MAKMKIYEHKKRAYQLDENKKIEFKVDVVDCRHTY